MQCSIKWNSAKGRWEPSPRGKIIGGLKLFGGDLPPFVSAKITHGEWLALKRDSKKWEDCYFDIPSDTISRLYLAKGCHYIQISDGFGLYRLAKDTCGFGVPLFAPKQQLRARIKVHSRGSSRASCQLSITIACQPKNIKSDLAPSPHSLDSPERLPAGLTYAGALEA